MISFFYLVKILVRKIRQVFLQHEADVKSTTACFLHSEGKHHCLERDFGDLERNNIGDLHVKSYNKFIPEVNIACVAQASPARGGGGTPPKNG